MNGGKTPGMPGQGDPNAQGPQGPTTTRPRPQPPPSGPDAADETDSRRRPAILTEVSHVR